MKVVVVNGPARNGKDSFINFAIEYASTHNIIVESCSIVDSIKHIARQCGWTGKKEDEDRKFLSDLKDLLSDYNDFPYKTIYSKILSFKEYVNNLGLGNYNIVYFVIAREPDDISRFVDDFKAITVFINRGLSIQQHGNHADDYVFDYNYDYTIMNDGSLDDLKESANVFMANLFDVEEETGKERDYEDRD